MILCADALARPRGVAAQRLAGGGRQDPRTAGERGQCSTTATACWRSGSLQLLVPSTEPARARP